MRIDILPTFDEAGAATAEAVSTAIRAAVPGARIEVKTSAKPLALTASVARADAVVLDLTPQGAHRYTAMTHPWLQSHVLAVSRSWFPVNVSPARRGGAAAHGEYLTDEQIAAWVVDQLTGRDAVDKRSFLRRFGAGLIGGEVDRWARVSSFISYRSKDLDAALELREKLLTRRTDPTQEVVLLEPGVLAHQDEAMPSLLRWSALAVISDIVRAARDVWVVESDDYLASWWTQGELLCRPYFNNESTLHVYSARSGESRPAPAALQVELSPDDHRRLARHFANSHPDLMGPESRAAMRHLRGTRFSMAADAVFSDEFWDVPLIQCPRCSQREVPRTLDVHAFLTNTEPRLYPVAAQVLERHAGSGSPMPCVNGCGESFAIRLLPPRHLWYRLPTGPSASFLEPIQTFLATASAHPGAAEGAVAVT